MNYLNYTTIQNPATEPPDFMGANKTLQLCLLERHFQSHPGLPFLRGGSA